MGRHAGHLQGQQRANHVQHAVRDKGPRPRLPAAGPKCLLQEGDCLKIFMCENDVENDARDAGGRPCDKEANHIYCQEIGNEYVAAPRSSRVKVGQARPQTPQQRTSLHGLEKHI